MTTGQHHDTSPTDDQRRQYAHRIMDILLASFNGEQVNISGSGDRRHLQPQDCTGSCPTAQLNLSDDGLALTLILGNHSWRGPVATDGEWEHDKTDQRLSSDGMVEAVIRHLAQRVF